MLCPVCGKPLVYQNTRNRVLKSTVEEGLAYTSVEVVVGCCPLEGRYKTVLPPELIRYKHYNYYEIQMILNGEEDYCLACERTKAYWRSWFKGVWKSVIRKISGAIHACVSNEDIERSLLAFLKTEAKEWLRYVLALFQSDVNNLCTLFSLNPSTVHQRGKVMPICSECKGINSKTHAPGG